MPKAFLVNSAIQDLDSRASGAATASCIDAFCWQSSHSLHDADAEEPLHSLAPHLSFVELQCLMLFDIPWFKLVAF